MNDTWKPTPAELTNLWDHVRNSLWFVPVLCTFGGVMMAVGFLALDTWLDDSWERPFWLETSAEGAQTVLSTISGGTITVAGVVLSMTMVTLSIISSQFGSRVLRSLLGDRITQWTIGAFLGTTVYSLLVLKMVHKLGDKNFFVPHLSVMAAIVFALSSLLILLYFIHHVTRIAQAPEIVAMLGHDLHSSIDRIFPEQIGDPTPTDVERHDGLPDDVRDALIHGTRIYSQHEGYIQAIEAQMLLDWAIEFDAVLRLPKRPGDFLAQEECLAIVACSHEIDEEACTWQINRAFIFGNVRTPRQDVNCAVHELSQMAVRALSPGINDPYTAINCIDRLSSALAHLARRSMPDSNRYDKAGNLRLVVDRQAFRSVLFAAFDQIRYEAVRSVAVSQRLMEAFERIASNVTLPDQAEAVLHQARLTMEGLLEEVHHPSDVQILQEQFAQLSQWLQAVIEQRDKLPAQGPNGDLDEEGGATGEVIG